MSTLRQRMTDAMVLRGLPHEPRTSYLGCVSSRQQHYHQSPTGSTRQRSRHTCCI